MKKVAIFIFCAMLGNNLFSQDLEALFQRADTWSLKNIDSCISICLDGFDKAKSKKDIIYQASFKTLIGKAFYFNGQYDSAAFYYNASIQMLETQKPTEKLGFTYNELAKLYRRTQKYDNALATYEKALSIYESLNDKKGMGMIYNERGVVYEDMGQLEEALNLYKKSYDIAVELNDLTGQAYALNFMATIYSLQHKMKDANEGYALAIELHKQVNDTFALGWCYLDQAKHLCDMLLYNEAQTSLTEAREISLALRLPDLLSKSYFIQSKIDSAQGKNNDALMSFKKYISLKDSLFNADNNKVIEELNSKYESRKKENLINEQKSSLQQKNLILLSSFLAFSLLGGLVWWNIKQKKIANEKKLQAEIMKQQDIATKAVIEAEERERLRIAADLHDGIGQLLSAAKMNLHAIEENFSQDVKRPILEKAIYLVNESAKEIRSVSHNIMPNALLKSGLGFAVKDFIEKLDQNQLRVNVNTVGLNEKIPSDIEIVVYRIIQECVNNVIKHAHANRLDISLVREKNTLEILIEDNGKGFDVNLALEKSGIGLKNIQTRVDYLKGTLDIDSQLNNGTVMAIHIPINEANENG